MIGWLADFLLGKSPEIFDDEGKVRHNLPEKKWNAWSNRYSKSPEYNWRNHTGVKAKDNKTTSNH